MEPGGLNVELASLLRHGDSRPSCTNRLRTWQEADQDHPRAGHPQGSSGDLHDARMR